MDTTATEIAHKRYELLESSVAALIRFLAHRHQYQGNVMMSPEDIEAELKIKLYNTILQYWDRDDDEIIKVFTTVAGNHIRKMIAYSMSECRDPDKIAVHLDDEDSPQVASQERTMFSDIEFAASMEETLKMMNETDSAIVLEFMFPSDTIIDMIREENFASEVRKTLGITTRARRDLTLLRRHVAEYFGFSMTEVNEAVSRIAEVLKTAFPEYRAF